MFVTRYGRSFERSINDNPKPFEFGADTVGPPELLPLDLHLAGFVSNIFPGNVKSPAVVAQSAKFFGVCRQLVQYQHEVHRRLRAEDNRLSADGHCAIGAKPRDRLALDERARIHAMPLCFGQEIVRGRHRLDPPPEVMQEFRDAGRAASRLPRQRLNDRKRISHPMGEFAHE